MTWRQRVKFMDKFIKGMDVSSLPEETALGARFYDEGKEGDALEILKNTVPTLCASVSGMILTVRTASLTEPVPVTLQNWWHWLPQAKAGLQLSAGSALQ